MGIKSFNFSRGFQRLFFILIVIQAGYLLTACSPKTTGAVRDDVSITGQTDRLEEEGVKYSGPQYNVAILTFKNKTPSRVLGVGEAATDILRTIVKKAGLEPIVLSEDEMREQERLIELQQTGAVKTGRKSASEGFESLDYRVSGAVTSYSELEEGSDILIAQSKTQVARVQVDYALVDVATGRSLLAESGMGEYRKKTGGLFGLGSKSSVDVGLREGALRDALTKAMTRMVEKLNAQPFKGAVLAIDGPVVVVRAGTRSRIEPGTVLSVYRPGADLVDPDTGRVIGKRQKKIGEIVLTEHQGERISEAEISSGAGFRAGDIIKAYR
jgi:curli biogenesis system outer membrane secretion channel CsgG